MTEDWLDYWKEQDAYLPTDYQLAMQPFSDNQPNFQFLILDIKYSS